MGTNGGQQAEGSNPYLEKLKIDKFHLDREWEEQPIKFWEMAESFVEAQAIRDLAREKRDVVAAEVEQRIRTDPSRFGIDKPTESAIKVQVILHPDMKTMEEEYLQAVADSKLLEVAIQALEHRKRALENLTQLFLAGYYCRPYVPQQAKEQSEQAYHSKQVQGLESNARLRKRRKRDIMRQKL